MKIDFAEMADVFFNRRPCVARKGEIPTQISTYPVTIQELIRRGTSHVKVNGRTYKFVVTEVEVARGR